MKLKTQLTLVASTVAILSGLFAVAQASTFSVKNGMPEYVNKDGKLVAASSIDIAFATKSINSCNVSKVKDGGGVSSHTPCDQENKGNDVAYSHHVFNSSNFKQYNMDVVPKGDAHFYPEIQMEGGSVHWVDEKGQDITDSGAVTCVADRSYFHPTSNGAPYLQMPANDTSISNSAITVGGKTYHCSLVVNKGPNGATFVSGHYPVVINQDEDYRSTNGSGQAIPLDAIGTDLLDGNGGSIDLRGLSAVKNFNVDPSGVKIKVGATTHMRMCKIDSADPYNYDINDTNCLSLNNNFNLIWHRAVAPLSLPVSVVTPPLLQMFKGGISIKPIVPGLKWAPGAIQTEKLNVIVNNDVRAYSFPELTTIMHKYLSNPGSASAPAAFLPRVNVIQSAPGLDLAQATQNYFGSSLDLAKWKAGHAGRTFNLLDYLFDKQGAAAANISLQFHSEGETYANKLDQWLNPFAAKQTAADRANHVNPHIDLPTVVYLPAPGQTASGVLHGQNAYWYNADANNPTTVNIDGATISVKDGNLTGSLTKPGLYEINLEAVDSKTQHKAWRTIYVDVASDSSFKTTGTDAVLQARLKGRSWLWTYNTL